MPPRKVPPRKVPANDDGYFEILTKAVFQGGLSWEIVERKWENFRRAFRDFDIDAVAAFGPEDVTRLLADPGLVRNARKIEATVANAAAMRDLAREHGSLKAWLETSAGLPWHGRKKAVARPFLFFGPGSAYFFLWSVGEAVPPHAEEAGWTGPVPAGAPESLAAG